MIWLIDQLLPSKFKSGHQGETGKSSLAARKDSLFNSNGFNNSPPPSQPPEHPRPKPPPLSVGPKFHDQGLHPENQKPVPSKKIGWD